MSDAVVIWDGEAGAWFVEGDGVRVGPLEPQPGDDQAPPGAAMLLIRELQALRSALTEACDLHDAAAARIGELRQLAEEP